MKLFIICIVMKCKMCQTQLRGRQQKWCSLKCKNQSDNAKHKSYECQQKRGLERKIMFVKRRGGKCEACGYSKNYAALTFHHIDPSVKESGLTIRNMSNNSLAVLEREIEKCRLLCRNCHAEIHYPGMDSNSYSPDSPNSISD